MTTTQMSTHPRQNGTTAAYSSQRQRQPAQQQPQPPTNVEDDSDRRHDENAATARRGRMQSFALNGTSSKEDPRRQSLGDGIHHTNGTQVGLSRDHNEGLIGDSGSSDGENSSEQRLPKSLSAGSGKGL